MDRSTGEIRQVTDNPRDTSGCTAGEYRSTKILKCCLQQWLVILHLLFDVLIGSPGNKNHGRFKQGYVVGLQRGKIFVELIMNITSVAIGKLPGSIHFRSRLVFVTCFFDM